jgi:hypothetical protein
MKTRRLRVCALLAGVVALTRFVFRSRYLYDIDSVNFALALDHFDTVTHQPHPPGYFLYIWLGRLANAMLHDANGAFVAISIVASAAAAVMIYLLADGWFGERPAIFAGVIFVFSPLCWFHGTVALTYIVEAFFSTAVGYILWAVYTGRAGLIMPASVALGFASGVRPSSFLMLGPLWLFSMTRVGRKKQVLLGCATLVVTVLGWFIPMTSASGGPAAYWSALFALWRMVPSKHTIFSFDVYFTVARFCVVVAILGLCFGAAAALVFRRGQSHVSQRSEKVRFTWVWITPGLLFFTFVFLNWVNSGYLLVVTPPLFAWLGLWAADWYTNARWSRAWKFTAIGACAAMNSAVFLHAPLYCSWSAVRAFEAELAAIQAALPQIAEPDSTLIVGFDAHFLGYRHAAYYFPDYFTVQYPEVPFPGGPRVFAVEHRSTRLLSRLPTERFSHFVLFPLPRGSGEYDEYVTRVRARFQPGALHNTVSGGREFITGSVFDLPALFPTVARRSVPVYTELHDGTRAVYSR